MVIITQLQKLVPPLVAPSVSGVYLSNDQNLPKQVWVNLGNLQKKLIPEYPITLGKNRLTTVENKEHISLKHQLYGVTFRSQN